VELPADLLDRPTAHIKLAAHPRDRVHALHPLPPVQNHRTGTAALQRTGGQFWTPIPDLTGSTFHADPQPARELWAGRSPERRERGRTCARSAGPAGGFGSE